jgi:hypothetical protein
MICENKKIRELILVMWRNSYEAAACALELNAAILEEGKLYRIDIQILLGTGRLYFTHVGAEKGQNRVVITGNAKVVPIINTQVKISRNCYNAMLKQYQVAKS